MIIQILQKTGFAGVLIMASFLSTACGLNEHIDGSDLASNVTEVNTGGRVTTYSTVTLRNSSDREIFTNVLVRTNTRIHSVFVERLGPYETRVLDQSYGRGVESKWFCVLDNNPRGNSRRQANVFGANLETTGIYFTDPRRRRDGLVTYTLSPTHLVSYRLGKNGPFGGQNMAFNNIRVMNQFLRGPVGTDLAAFDADYVYRCKDLVRKTNSEIGIAWPVL